MATKRTTKRGNRQGGKRPVRKRTTKAGVPQAKRKEAAKRKAPPNDDDTEEPPPSSRRAEANAARRLETVLRALPAGELAGLIKRMKIRVDENKRIDVPAQVARALVRLPELRDPSRLPSASKELLRRVAEANGTLRVDQLPAGLELLVRRGVLYARVDEEGVELVLPTAFLVQMKPWDGEDQRSLRVLLAEAPFETAGAVAAHFLGRPSTPPIALSLEPAWEILGDPRTLQEELASISHQERRLLEQIEEVGGEVETQELMDLEREPMRIRGAYGVAAGRRGAAFSLEKRGFLFPQHPNRYVLPTEVALLVGAERRAEREKRREEIREHVLEEDYMPRRANFSTDPAPVTMALTMHWRQSGTDVKEEVGTPRTLVNRLAQKVGRESQTAAMLIAFGRAMGLWEREGVSAATPPGNLTLAGLTLELFQTWRRGGVWDEAREEHELLRVPAEMREASPSGVVREMVLDALTDLGEGSWVPLPALMAYVANDPRGPGFERVAERWAGRVGLKVPKLTTVAERILISTLPALGVVDLGGADKESASGSGEIEGLAIRLTGRGKQLMTGLAGRQHAIGEFVDERRLAVGQDARVSEVLAVLPFCEVTASEARLELEVSQATIAGGLALGVQVDEMRSAIEALAEVPPDLTEALDRAGAVIGRGELVAAGGFLWIDDPEVRRMLMSSSGTSDMFLDPSPPGGLLLSPTVDPERLARRCRALGVDVTIDEEVFRIRASTMPPPKRSSTQKAASWRPPARRRRTSSET